jgi:hypothetical protein
VLHVFRDKSYPHDSVNRTHDYPQEAIMQLPFPVYIKKMDIRDSYIEYKEKNDKSDSSGKVAFFHVQASVEQVTNMTKYIRQNDKMLVKFNASFLNASPFSAKIFLRLNDGKGSFHMDAGLGEMNAPTLNALLKPMALAELKKGSINRLSYHLDATNTRGRGRLLLQYDNLSIKILKKDDKRNKYKTKVLPTLAADFLIKESNPQNGNTRIGEVEYTRDIHRSIFNLMWKSLFAAIKKVAMSFPAHFLPQAEFGGQSTSTHLRYTTTGKALPHLLKGIADCKIQYKITGIEHPSLLWRKPGLAHRYSQIESQEKYTDVQSKTGSDTYGNLAWPVFRELRTHSRTVVTKCPVVTGINKKRPVKIREQFKPQFCIRFYFYITRLIRNKSGVGIAGIIGTGAQRSRTEGPYIVCPAGKEFFHIRHGITVTIGVTHPTRQAAGKYSRF